MISRREFVMFSLVASGCCLMPKAAFADMDSIQIVDSLGQAVEFEAAPSEIVPLGNYAQSVLYSINPTLLDFPSFGTLDEGSSQSASEQASSQGLRGSRDFVEDNALLVEAESLSCPSVDIGSAEKSSRESLDAIKDRTDRPAIFLAGGFESLASSYRELAPILREDRCYEMAEYIDEVVSLVMERQSCLAMGPAKTIYIASGETGIEFETFKYLQANVFSYLNCECINNRSELAADSLDEGSIFDMDKIVALSPDYVIFKDVEPDVFHDPTSAVRFLWKRTDQVSRGDAYCVPRTEFGWLGSPLVSQCLGILWLGSVLYPESFSDIDVIDYANRFFRLFVHGADGLGGLRAALEDRAVRI